MKRTRLVEAQYRANNTETEHTIEGYAALYNVLSEPIYYVYDSEGQRKAVRERLAPGAFDEAAGPGADVTCNIDHDDSRLLGRTRSNTCKLKPDALGLGFHTEVPDTSYARDLGVLMQREDIRDCSFAFTVDEADIERSIENDYIVETVKRVKRLYDIAIVVRGAYPQPFSVFRNLPSGSEIKARNSAGEFEAFRYSQEAEPAASTREGKQSSEHTALRAQQEQSRALELARLDLAAKTLEV